MRLLAQLVQLTVGGILISGAEAPGMLAIAQETDVLSQEQAREDDPENKRQILRVLIRAKYPPLSREEFLGGVQNLRQRQYGEEIVVHWEDILDHRFYAGFSPEINDAMTVIETEDRVYFEDAGYSLQKLTFRMDYFNLRATENHIYAQTWSGGALVSRINMKDYGQIWTRYQLKEIEDLNEPLNRHLDRMLTRF